MISTASIDEGGREPKVTWLLAPSVRRAVAVAVAFDRGSYGLWSLLDNELTMRQNRRFPISKLSRPRTVSLAKRRLDASARTRSSRDADDIINKVSLPCAPFLVTHRGIIMPRWKTLAAIKYGKKDEVFGRISNTIRSNSVRKKTTGALRSRIEIDPHQNARWTLPIFCNELGSRLPLKPSFGPKGLRTCNMFFSKTGWATIRMSLCFELLQI